MPTKPDPYSPPREDAVPPGRGSFALHGGRAPLRARMLMGLGALALILSVAVLPMAQRVDRLMAVIDPGTDYFLEIAICGSAGICGRAADDSPRLGFPQAVTGRSARLSRETEDYADFVDDENGRKRRLVTRLRANESRIFGFGDFRIFGRTWSSWSCLSVSCLAVETRMTTATGIFPFSLFMTGNHHECIQKYT
jgi:hypothetical protein